MPDLTDTQTAEQIPPMSDRDALADKLAECAYEGMSARETADALLEVGVRPPARVITTLAEMDELPYGTVIRCRMAIYQHCGYGQWLMPGGHPRAHSLRLLQWAAEAGAALILLFDPRTEGQADA